MTADQAERVIAALRDVLDDLERISLPSSHTHVATGERELGPFVYPDAAALDADAADLLT